MTVQAGDDSNRADGAGAGRTPSCIFERVPRDPQNEIRACRF